MLSLSPFWAPLCCQQPHPAMCALFLSSRGGQVRASEVGRWAHCPAVLHGLSHFTSQSLWKLQACQFPTLGRGPPASRLEMCALTLKALPLDARPAVLEPTWPQARWGLPDSASTGPELTAHLPLLRKQGGRQFPPNFIFSHQGGISDSQPWVLSLVLILYKLLPF